MRVSVFVSVLLPCMLLFGVSGSAAGPEEIILASPFAKGTILNDAAEHFKASVEKESRGRFTVSIKHAAGSEQQVNEMCSQGSAQMQVNGGSPLEVFAPQYFFFNAPYVIADFPHYMRVWNGPLGEKAKDLVDKKGSMTYLGIIYRGLRQMTSVKQVYTPSEVKSLKLRLPVIKTWIAVWKELGADPVPVPISDLYSSLKSGKAESSEGDLPQISVYKLNEVQQYLIMTNHLVQTGGILINGKFFARLSASDKKMIQKAAAEASAWANDYIMNNEAKIIVDLQKKGMKVVIPDASAIREKAKPAVEELFKTEWPVTTWKEVLSQ